MPWHTALQGDGAGDWEIVVRCNHHPFDEVRSAPIHFNLYTETDSIFTSESLNTHGAVIEPDTPMEVTWNADLLHHFHQEAHQFRNGELRKASDVTFKLIGEVLDEDGNLVTRTRHLIGDKMGFPNTGAATLTIPKEATEASQGHRHLMIVDRSRPDVLGWSKGYFTVHRILRSTLLTSTRFHKVEDMNSFIGTEDGVAIKAREGGKVTICHSCQTSA